VTHRAGFAKLRSLTKINPRLATNLAKTMLGGQRDLAVVDAFNAHAEQAASSSPRPGPATTSRSWPRCCATSRPSARQDETIRYMEIGAYEGRNLAFMDWLLPIAWPSRSSTPGSTRP
jgi:hypothetical protein